MKFGCSWRKISRKSGCRKDSESTLQGRTVKNVNFNRIGSWDHGSSSGSPAQGKRQRVWDVHCDGGGAVSLFLCGGKAGSDSENTSDDGILHRDQSSVFVGALKMAGITYIAEFASGICKDAGYGSLGTQIEIFAKLSILAVSMPILLALLETVKQFLA
jgi:hypothetical protein